jgi:hypothetical protein
VESHKDSQERSEKEDCRRYRHPAFIWSTKHYHQRQQQGSGENYEVDIFSTGGERGDKECSKESNGSRAVVASLCPDN